MNTKTHMAIFLLAFLGIFSACSSGTPAGPSLISDSTGLDSFISDTNLPDIEHRPDLDSPPDSQVPQAGEPCQDDDPCTNGETIQTDGSCGGGQTSTCDDGRECTTDQCDGKGNCLYEIAPGRCLIDGICYLEGPGSCPENCCRTCQPETATSQWETVAPETPCDDLNACTSDDQCDESGNCQGQTSTCDDLDPCTADHCDSAVGCIHDPASGIPCETDNLCTAWSFCEDGQCLAGEETDCDDENPCTAEDCDPEVGCIYTPLDGVECDDGDVCTIDDNCEADACVPGTQALDCNDGNECTGDLCHPVSGCYHELNDNPCCDDSGVNMCDDGNWCTVDNCNPDTGECFYEPNALACDDQDPCTGPDACLEGQCQAPPLDCDDGNQCTLDDCQPTAGCQHAPLSDQPCNDGLDCSVGDHCEAGLCIADTTDCQCQPDFHPGVNKLTVLAIGSGGHPGSGLDVDLKPDTCAPADNCSEGIDNSLAMFGDLAGDALQDAVDAGQVVLLFEHREFDATGAPYMLAFYVGSAADPDCEIQSQSCPYLVQSDSFDDQCSPLISLDNAVVNGAQLAAGGPGYDFPLPLPLSEGVILDLVLYNAQVEATLAFSDGLPGSMTGILAGAVPKQTLLDALDNVPADQLPVDKELVKTMVNMLVQNDVDSDGDGSLDAASIGLPFTALQGQIVGVD